MNQPRLKSVLLGVLLSSAATQSASQPSADLQWVTTWAAASDFKGPSLKPQTL
jgi:hypothetical protein